jgi:hydrogenase-4 membrane subunit HyfE
MEKILDKNAGTVAFISTAAFAILIWLYILQGSDNAAGFIIIGIAFILLDLLALWSMMVKKLNNKKKGKK